MLSIVNFSQGKSLGSFIVDDFHRLDDHLQADIANLVKTIAELWDAQKYPKIIIVGINKVGSELINLVSRRVCWPLLDDRDSHGVLGCACKSHRSFQVPTCGARQIA